MFAFQKLRNGCGCERCADIADDIRHNAGEQIHIADFVAPDHIVEDDRIVDVMQILPAWFGRIAEIGKVGHPAQRQVLLKSCRVGCNGFNCSVEFEKFSKREGVNGKFHIAPAQHGRQFAGQQLGVGAGDVNVAVQLNAEGVDGFFPLRNFLNLIKKQIDFARDGSGPFQHLFVQRLCRAEVRIAHDFKVKRNHLRILNARRFQLVLDEIQHDGLAAAPDAGHHLHQICPDKRADTLHVHFPLNHAAQPPFDDTHSMAHLRRKIKQKQKTFSAITEKLHL